MQLEQIQIETEKSAKFEHHVMGIEDTRLIIEYLSKKLYSDPIKIICQEIPSNGRDAHRELGNEKTPIEITIPNSFVPYYVVKDFGIGMDYQRLTTVYKMYSASTKRNTDKQTGGFGVGAKCPWAYTDLFTVETVAKENGKNIKRTLVMSKTEDNEVGFDIVETKETDEPTGTTVKVPAKKQDYDKFLTETIRATLFWSIPPVIKGHEDSKVEKPTTYIAGKGWNIVNNTNSHVDMEGEFFVSIDGILYPIDNNRVSNELYNTIYSFLQNHRGFVLEAGVSDVTVALSREMLDYTPRTVAFLNEGMQRCVDSIKEHLINDILSKPSLLEAQQAYHQHNRTYGRRMPQTLDWTSPTGIVVKLNPSEWISIKGSVCHAYTSYNGKLKRDNNHDIELSTPIYVSKNGATKGNKEANRNQILGIMDAEKISKLQIINYYDKTDTNTKNLLELSTLKIVENFPKRKIQRTVGTTGKVVKRLGWFIKSYRTEPIENITSYAELIKQSYTHYVLKDTMAQFKLSPLHTAAHDRYNIRSIAASLKVNVVVINPTAVKEAEAAGMKSLYSAILDAVNTAKTVLSEDDAHVLNEKSGFLPLFHLNTFKSVWHNKPEHAISIFIEAYEAAKAVQKQLGNQDDNYLKRHLLAKDIKNTQIDQKAFNLKDLLEMMRLMYPMLCLNTSVFDIRENWNARGVTEEMKHFVEYIQTVDNLQEKSLTNNATSGTI